MSMTRQQIRAQSRLADKYQRKLEKLEDTTQRLIELGALKKKRKPIFMRVKDFVRSIGGRNGEQKGME
jgi:hypothetical protein